MQSISSSEQNKPQDSFGTMGTPSEGTPPNQSNDQKGPQPEKTQQVASGEEQLQQAQSNQNQTQQTNPTPNIYKQMADKTMEPEKKRHFFGANLFIFLSFLIFIGGGLGIYALANDGSLYPLMQKTVEISKTLVQTSKDLIGKLAGGPMPNIAPTPEPTPTPQVTPTPQENPVDPNGLIEYTSPNFEFSFKYPATAKVLEPDQSDNQLDTYRVTFAGETQNEEIKTDANIKDGYMFTFTVFENIINRNIDQIAIEKRNRYYIQCPETAKIGDIKERTIANRTAKTFEVENCGVNYVHSFFLRDTDLFEFIQVYRGDLGIRQIYKADTNRIVDNFQIINSIKPSPVGTWATHTREELTYKYPGELNTTCCSLRGPISAEARKIAIYANEKSIQQGQNNKFDGFAVYYDELRSQSLDSYVETQKNLLEENYRVIIGRAPATDIRETTVGGQRAITLINYAWWGDITFVASPRGRTVYAFVMSEIDKGSFQAIFDEMLTTVQFNN